MKSILMTLTALLFAASAFAAEGTVSLSPAVIMLRGEAGQSTTQTLFVRNGTSRKLTFEVSAQDVVVRDGVRAMLPAGEIPASVAATAVFSERRVMVAPGEMAPVTMRITIPPNATTRAVVALFRGTDRFVNGSLSSTASLGALLTFALSDEVLMTAEPLRVQEQSPTSNLAVAQICRNSGSEPLIAKGMLAVIGEDGRIAGKAALQPKRLLPGETAQLGAEYAAELQPGKYRLLLTYNYEQSAMTQSAEIDVR